LNNQNVTLLNNRGMLFYQQNRFTEALVSFEQVLQIDTQNATAQLNRGNTLVLLNEPELALNAYKQSIQIRPGQYEAWEGLAKLYMLSADMQSAENCWHRAIEANPSNPGLVMGLAQVYLTQNKFNEVLEIVDFIQSQYPNNQRALQTAGLAHLMLKNYGLAINFLNRSLFLVPDDTAVRNHLAVALLQSGDMEAGYAEYETILTQEPENEEARLNAAILCLGFNRWNEAVAHLDRLLESDPQHGKAGFYRGVAYLKLNHNEDAREQFESVIKGDGGEWALQAQKQLNIMNNLN
jgi:tetratricopeptide (TPR) repeat protein